MTEKKASECQSKRTPTLGCPCCHAPFLGEPTIAFAQMTVHLWEECQHVQARQMRRDQRHATFLEKGKWGCDDWPDHLPPNIHKLKQQLIDLGVYAKKTYLERWEALYL